MIFHLKVFKIFDNQNHPLNFTCLIELVLIFDWVGMNFLCFLGLHFQKFEFLILFIYFAFCYIFIYTIIYYYYNFSIFMLAPKFYKHHLNNFTTYHNILLTFEQFFYIFCYHYYSLLFNCILPNCEILLSYINNIELQSWI